MKRSLAWLLFPTVGAVGWLAGTLHHPVSRAAPPAAAAAPAPGSLGIDETALDKSVNPCEDFYQYACGNWVKRTEIPSDRSEWARSFSVLDQSNKTNLRAILDEMVANVKAGKPAGPDQYADKVAAFYASCMDEAKIESATGPELQKLFATVDAIKDLDSLSVQVAKLHAMGSSGPFSFKSTQDLKDATLVIGDLSQGGLSLPDRDYYLKDDAKLKDIRTKFRAHVKAMLTLAGVPAAEADKQAGTVLALETELAKASMSRVEMRDPQKTYHRLELAGTEKTAPHFAWKKYFAELGHAGVQQINVNHPPFFAAVDAQLTKQPIEAWRTYLRWRILHASAETLPKKFVDENFAFYGKTLTGAAELAPRWKRCVAATDQLLGEALARPYVRLHFPANAKTDAQSLVKNVEAAMEKNITGLPWMDEPTRKAAFEKLHAIFNKIGYPEKWRSYDALTVKADDVFLANGVRAERFETNRDLDKIGKKLDRTEWEMTPPTVNAYYEPSLNEMVFPAGILQAPFYSPKAHPAVNYGAIGMVVGHELTHGFDDEGRQFDARGNLRDWWTPSANAEFEKRAQCVVKQFDGFSVYDLHVNGKLTLGENLADLGGIKLAFAAYKASKGGRGPDKVGAFTDEQLFFLGTAQSWCDKRREQLARDRVLTDPHSPPEYRINGPLANLPEFAAAFQCKPGQKMARTGANQCAVW